MGSGCRSPDASACFEAVRPDAERVVAVAQSADTCQSDTDCALVEPDFRCWDGCAVATRRENVVEVEAAAREASARCPDCAVEASCAVVVAYCEGARGRCETCRSLATVGDGRDPSDRCFEPPEHYCSGVDPAAPPVVACSAGGMLCCTFPKGCVPCTFTRCDLAPAAPGCDRPPDDDDRCPYVPSKSVCLDPERYAPPG